MSSASTRVSPLLAGMSWLTAGTVMTRVLSLVSQLVLAALLAKEDFGTYAVVVGLVAVANSIAGAGVNNLLIQRGKDAFNGAAPAAFWVALCFNLLLAALLGIAGPFLAKAYNDPRIAWMLLLIGLSFVMHSATIVLKARLSVNLQFSKIAQLLIFSNLLKYLLIVTLAWSGLGPYSFVIPLPIIAFVEVVFLCRWVNMRPWSHGLHIERWGKLMRATSWIIVGQAATGLLQSADYLVLGLFLPVGVLGIYYFAYELVAQVGALFAQNVHRVLFPVLVEGAGEASNQRAQTLRGLRLIVPVATFLSLAVAVVIEPLAIVSGWEARFPGIVEVVQVLALFFPLRMLVVVTRSSLMSRGEFRQLTVLIVVQGLGLIVATTVVAALSDRLPLIALVIGLYLGSSSLLFLFHTLRKLGLGKTQVLRPVLIGWISGVAAGGLAILVSNYHLETTLWANALALVGNLVVSLVIFLLTFVSILWLFPEYRLGMRRLRAWIRVRIETHT